MRFTLYVFPPPFGLEANLSATLPQTGISGLGLQDSTLSVHTDVKAGTRRQDVASVSVAQDNLEHVLGCYAICSCAASYSLDLCPNTQDYAVQCISLLFDFLSILALSFYWRCIYCECVVRVQVQQPCATISSSDRSSSCSLLTMTVRFLSSSKSGSMSSHEGKGGETSHIEEIGTTQKPGFGTRLKAHYRRFWWLHLIIFVSATLIIVLCLYVNRSFVVLVLWLVPVRGKCITTHQLTFSSIYVASPRISQDGINGSTLEIQSLILSNPTPNSFHLEQTALIGNENSYHPRLDSFNASLSLHNPASQSENGEGKDVAYAYITLPAIHATKTATSYVNQTVQITDLDAFKSYNAAVLGGEEVQVRVKGRTDLHLMRFPTTAVDYDKVVTMKGQSDVP